MSEANRRYFLASGPKTQEMLAGILKRREAYFEARRAFQAKYKADALFDRRGMIVGLGFKEPGNRPGLRVTGNIDDHFLAYPDRRFKDGKQIDAEMQAANRLSGGQPSDLILKFFDASRMTPQSDPNSPTGMSLAVSVGHPIHEWKDCVVSVPEEKGHPFTPHEEMTEIKHHQFIAYVEGDA
jgi:hypothetical protein